MLIMYHNIGDSPGFNTVAVRRFEEQALLVRGRRRIVGFGEYVDAVMDCRPDDCAALTFDDAYVSFRDLALPVLERHDLPAILFVPAGRVGGEGLWDSAQSSPIPLLGWNDLAKLAAHPLVTVGSHGLSHRSLGGMSSAEREREIAESRHELESRLGVGVVYFSFPYGQPFDIPGDAAGMLGGHGYRAACSTRYGRRNRPADRYHLKRIEITPNDTARDAAAKCFRPVNRALAKRTVKDVLYCFGYRR